MMMMMMMMMIRFEQYLWPSAGSGEKTSVLLPLIKTFGLFYFIAGVYQLINIVLVLLNPQVYIFDISIDISIGDNDGSDEDHDVWPFYMSLHGDYKLLEV